MGFSDELVKATIDWILSHDEWDFFRDAFEHTQAPFDLELILSIAEQINAPFDFLFDYEVPEPIWDDLSEFFAL